LNRIVVERVTLGVLTAGFIIGTITHVLHLVTAGWIVFDAAPTWMNVYWTGLTLLDPLAAVLIVAARRIGLALGAAIIVSDVAINSYGLYALGLPFGFLSVQLQTLFCGFLLGACGFLAGRSR